MGEIVPYEAVIFDWDGCIGKTLHCWVNEFRSAFNQVGLSPTDDDITGRFGQWDRISELGIPKEQLAEFIAGVRSVAEAALTQVELYPGAQETLLRLREQRLSGKIGGLVLWTGSFTEAISAPLAHHSLTDVFDVVVTKSDLHKPKPDPEGLYYALGKLGFNSNLHNQRAVMVGDTDKDIMAARNAGIDSVWINHPDNLQIYGEQQIKEFRNLNPTYEVSSFSELDSIIL